MVTVKVQELAYVRVRVPDIDLAQQFHTDLGMLVSARTDDTLYMRGSGPAHHILVSEQGDDKFVSLAFQVADEADLAAAAAVPGASSIEAITEPGGGKRVWLTDPDGNRVEIVWGIEPVEIVSHERLPLNDAVAGLRRANKIMRHERGPAKIARVGHGVLMSPDPIRSIAWYRDHLGLLCSDEIVVDGKVGLTFNRLDHGEEFVDHHVLLVQVGPTTGLNHVGFEVQDIDDLMLGHDHMTLKGYDNVWGIGRHVFGAQIFDYWMDPWGFMYEMWTDTDRMNADFVGINDATVDEANGPWGMDVPDRFFAHVHP